MSFFGRLFATPDSISKTLDAAISAGDKLVFTAEEKAEMNLKIQDWYLEYLKATQPMNLSRRVLTFIIGGIWALFLSIGTMFALFNHTETAELMWTIMSDNVNTPFTIVVGFYFAAHVMRNLSK